MAEAAADLSRRVGARVAPVCSGSGRSLMMLVRNVRSDLVTERSRMAHFAAVCAAATGREFPDHRSFHQFSVAEFRRFWSLFLDWSRLPVEGMAEPVCTSDDV